MSVEQESNLLNRDELTGLLEKQTFYNCCQELIDTMQEEGSYAFVFFDIENFKIFNGNYGFEEGDQLLKEVGNIISDVFSGQLIARFSGDHFVVFTTTIQIIPAIKQVKQQVKLNQKGVNLEMKAGIFIVDDNKLEAKRCCDRARIACISIKKRYDLEYRFYDEELDGTIQKKQFILDNLDEAIEKGYIKVYYQPMIRTLTGKLCAWEALVRWIDPEKGMIFPNEFIPVLEEYRLIYKVDHYVSEQVIKNISELMKAGKEVVPVSINLSRLDFETSDIRRVSDGLIEKYNCPKHMIHYEITESELTENPAFIMSQVKKLRNNGYSVWMDDFGSGYSALNGLKSFEFDLVKIDMEFLKDFDTTDNGKIILKHIISLLKNLGIHTLIEGVETKEQYEYMTRLGCEIVQGYLFGRPLPFEDGVENIRKSNIEVESPDEREFFTEIGKIDVLRQNPLQNIGKALTRNPLPLAIGMVKDKKWKFVYANLGYLKEIDRMGSESLANAEDMINNSAVWERHVHFWELLRGSKDSGEQEVMDFVERGKIINLRVRHVVAMEESGLDAYLISMRVVSRFLNDNMDEKLNLISRSMFSFYECVDLFGISEDYYENIYLVNRRLHLDDKCKSANEIINELANKQIHRDDKEKFLEFMDLKTAEERIEETRDKKLIGVFRILDSRGNYQWKTVIITIVSVDGRVSLLSCVSVVSHELVDSFTKKTDIVGRIDLENVNDTVLNVLKLAPLGIFWKDKDRKFLGANKMFLDYYGFKSVNSILGKTDEDMGWHINPEPFKQDELRVINDGKVIKDVPGECIVKGEVRKILATKKPFIIDGKIVGLIGFFRDVTEDSQEIKKLESISVTDELTGVYNRRGYKDILEKYEKQYQETDQDFALFLLDIDRFKQMNDLYGHEFGDVVLKKVSEKLKVVASESSTLFRLGGDEFIILHQINNKQEIESVKQEINMNIADLTSIDNVEVKIRLSVGVALYSEIMDTGKLLDKADMLMYEDKVKHKNEQKRLSD